MEEYKPKNSKVIGTLDGIVSGALLSMAAIELGTTKLIQSPIGLSLASLGVGIEGYNGLKKGMPSHKGFLMASVGLGLSAIEKMIYSAYDSNEASFADAFFDLFCSGYFLWRCVYTKKLNKTVNEINEYKRFEEKRFYGISDN